MKSQTAESVNESAETQVDQLPPFPYELLDAIRKDRLILFLGAGISCAAGAKDWNEISESILTDYREKNLLTNEEIGKLSSEHYYTRFEFLNRKDNDLFQRKFVELLDIKNQTIIDKYGSLVNKLRKFEPVSIVTTNVDDLMQKSKIFNDDEYYYRDECNPQRIHRKCIFCLHGNINNNIFILSEKSKYYGNSDFKYFLHNMFGSFCILFLGYSLDLRDVFEGCHPNTTCSDSDEYYHHALVPSDQQFEEYKLQMSYNVKLHRYKNDSTINHRNFIKTVDDWLSNIDTITKTETPSELPSGPEK